MSHKQRTSRSRRRFSTIYTKRWRPAWVPAGQTGLDMQVQAMRVEAGKREHRPIVQCTRCHLAMALTDLIQPRIVSQWLPIIRWCVRDNLSVSVLLVTVPRTCDCLFHSHSIIRHHKIYTRAYGTDCPLITKFIFLSVWFSLNYRLAITSISIKRNHGYATGPESMHDAQNLVCWVTVDLAPELLPVYKFGLPENNNLHRFSQFQKYESLWTNNAVECTIRDIYSRSYFATLSSEKFRDSEEEHLVI